MRDAVMKTVQEQTESLRQRITSTTHKLLETLRAAAKILEIEDVPIGEELSGAVREIPSFDPAFGELRLKRSLYFSLIGGNLSRSLMAKRLAGMMGEQLAQSLSAYHSLLYDWSERTLCQIQRKFDAYATNYRAQLAGLIGDGSSSVEQEGLIRRDLVALENA